MAIDEHPPAPAAGSDWTDPEVEQTVAVYFDMLRQELVGQRYVKARDSRERRFTPRAWGRRLLAFPPVRG